MILTIARHELRRLLLSPLAWVILACAQIILSWQFLEILAQFNELTPAQQQGGLTAQLSLRLFGLAAVVSLFIAPLLSMRLLSDEYHNGCFALLRSAPIADGTIIGGKYLGLMSYLFIITLIPLALSCSLQVGTQLDSGRLFAAWLGLLLLNAGFGAIGLMFSSLTRHPAVAAISGYGLLLFLSLAGNTGGAFNQSGIFEWITWSEHLLPFQLGQLRGQDLAYFLLLTSLPLILAGLYMQQPVNGKDSFRRQADRLLFQLLLLVAAGLLALLSTQYRLQWDWTRNAGNSLNQASIELLQQLESPLRITSFAPENRRLRSRIRQVVSRYQQHRPDIELHFINPESEPSLTREQGITLSGELLLEYQGRRETLQRLSEQTLSNAILRLLGSPDGWILSLNGHGERSLEGRANFDLAEFNQALQAGGYNSHTLSLASIGSIPDNTSLLIIAGPRIAPTRQEFEQIEHYLQHGGNLLLLIDPQPQQVLQPLLSLFQINTLPGIIVDANAAQLGLDNPAVAVVPGYPGHPALNGFKLLTLFPQASALTARPSTPWQLTPILSTQSQSWNETGTLRGEISRNPELGEQAGPLSIGLALSRSLPGGREQRAIVIGGGDFLSNAFLANAGNRELGLRLIRWLAEDERQLVIPTFKAADAQLQLSSTAKGIIGFGFLFLLPSLMLGSGFIIHWYRRRS